MMQAWLLQHAAGLVAVLLLLLLLAWWRPDVRGYLRVPLLCGLLVLPALLLPELSFWPPLLRLPSWLQEGLILLGGLALIRVLTLLLFYLLLPLLRWSPPRIVEDIVQALCFMAWGLSRLHALGMDFGQIMTTSAVITAVIAFAMQDTLGNLLAGVALQLDDSLSVGDWLEVDKVVGKVVEINWRATSLETRNWETVVIPNSMLLKQRFTVLGRRRGQPQQWRRWVWFDIKLDTLPSQIIMLVEKAMSEAQLPGVAAEPPPNCVLMSVENGIARYAVRYWLTDLLQDDGTDSSMRTLLDAALRRNDRHLAAPIFNVLVTKENEKYQEARHKRHTRERVAVLRQLSLFAMLDDNELVQLADQLKFTPFVCGDTMLEQGAVSDWLYVIASGKADMNYRTADGQLLSLGGLMLGDFFGEMGLLTGEASRYGVRALENVECYRVSRQIFHELFLQRDSLVTAVSQVLAQRLREQEALLQQEQQPSSSLRPQLEVLAKLRVFFGLG